MKIFLTPFFQLSVSANEQSINVLYIYYFIYLNVNLNCLCGHKSYNIVSSSLASNNPSKLVRNLNGYIFIQTVRNYISFRRLAIDTSSNCFSCFDLHVVGHVFYPVGGNSLENTREYQRIVYLVLEVAAAATIDHCAGSFGLLWHDFGDRVGQGEYNAFLCHFGSPVTS